MPISPDDLANELRKMKQRIAVLDLEVLNVGHAHARAVHYNLYLTQLGLHDAINGCATWKEAYPNG